MINFQMILTKKCNLSCDYCYVQQENNNDMTENDIDLIMSNIDEYLRVFGHKNYVLSFFGGEPLIKFDLMKYCIDKYINDDRMLLVRFPTNGLLMTQEMYDYFHSNPKISAAISFDGLWNKFNRPLKGGASSFDKYIERIKFFDQFKNSRCMISYNVCDTLVENYKFFVEGLNWRFPDFAFVKDNTWTKESADIFDHNCIKLVDYMVELWNKGIPNMPSIFRDRLESMLAIASRNKSARTCETCSWMFSFSPNGYAYSCSRFADIDKFRLYNYRTKEWYPDNFDLYSRIDIMTPSFISKCQKCEINAVCTGGCLVEELVENENGDYSRVPVEHFCSVLKTTFRETLRLFNLLKDNQLFQTYFTSQITPQGGRKSWLPTLNK